MDQTIWKFTILAMCGLRNSFLSGYNLPITHGPHMFPNGKKHPKMTDRWIGIRYL